MEWKLHKCQSFKHPIKIQWSNKNNTGIHKNNKNVLLFLLQNEMKHQISKSTIVHKLFPYKKHGLVLEWILI